MPQLNPANFPSFFHDLTSRIFTFIPNHSEAPSVVKNTYSSIRDNLGILNEYVSQFIHSPILENFLESNGVARIFNELNEWTENLNQAGLSRIRQVDSHLRKLTEVASSFVGVFPKFNIEEDFRKSMTETLVKARNASKTLAELERRFDESRSRIAENEGLARNKTSELYNDALIIKNELAGELGLAKELRSHLDSIQPRFESYHALIADSSNLLDDLKQIRVEARATLENASQAGLASAFGARKKSSLQGMVVYGGVFFIGILLLLVATLTPAESVLSLALNTADDTKEKFKPMALLLAKIGLTVPCIWLTWFAARQFSKTQKIMEDYAYKEASALAYVGYKQEMHDDPDMMKLLKEAAIKAFAENPSHLNSVPEPVSPMSDMLERAIDKIPGDKIPDLLVNFINKK